jgi:cysteine-rich repeat protein
VWGSGDGTCGNGAVEGDEECDDGNDYEGDGCDDRCQVEDGYECLESSSGSSTSCCFDTDSSRAREECEEETGRTSSSRDEPVCGNGEVEGDEECDDGNTERRDGCDQNCQVDFGFTCVESSETSASCCYDEDDDQARRECEGEDSSRGERDSDRDSSHDSDRGSSSRSSDANVCGNNVKDRGEQCDDGNTESGDGCNSECQVEEGWECSQTRTAEYRCRRENMGQASLCSAASTPAGKRAGWASLVLALGAAFGVRRRRL